MSNTPVQFIDLTASFTLAAHATLSNTVIELDDSLNETNRSCASRQNSVLYDIEAPVEVFDVSLTTASTPRNTRKKSTHSKKKKTSRPSTSYQRNENIRERSPVNVGDCPICFDEIGRNPLASTKCGHVFCMRCLEQSLRIEKKCPTCRQPLRGNKAYHPLFLNTDHTG